MKAILTLFLLVACSSKPVATHYKATSISPRGIYKTAPCPKHLPAETVCITPTYLR